MTNRSLPSEEARNEVKRPVVRLRDTLRNQVHELDPTTPILRGRYDLFRPQGPVKRQGPLATWLDHNVTVTSRVVSGMLRDVHPGESVLLRLGSDDDEWWLCDVEAVDGVGNT